MDNNFKSNFMKNMQINTNSIKVFYFISLNCVSSMKNSMSFYFISYESLDYNYIKKVTIHI